jgi:hypothetical protein
MRMRAMMSPSLRRLVGSDTSAKRISDMELSGIAANWICDELSTDGLGLHRVLQQA